MVKIYASRKDKIEADIARIEKQKIDSTNQLVGREWVWPQQKKALVRLHKRLDEELAVLRKELNAIGGKKQPNE